MFKYKIAALILLAIQIVLISYGGIMIRNKEDNFLIGVGIFLVIFNLIAMIPNIQSIIM